MRKKTALFLTLAITAMTALAGCTGTAKTNDAKTTTAATTTTKSNPIPAAGKPVNKYDKFFEEKDGVKHFYLWLEEKDWELMKGVTTPVWAFNGTIPGPEIRVQEGDKVAVHFRNTASQPHTIHFHGMADIEQGMDGVPITSQAIKPGGEYVYQFTATSVGTMMYHCHVSSYSHIDMGMSGALIVEPKNEKKTWDKEYTLMLDDWAVGTMDPFDKATHRDYNYFTVNGKSFPETTPIEGKVGEKVKIRFINIGNTTFSIHSHGYGGLITHLDGYPVPQPYMRDVFTVAPGERMDILITLREGAFPWHDHNLEHVLNNGEYLGGATFVVIGKKA